MTGLKRRFALSAVVLAAFALAGTARSGTSRLNAAEAQTSQGSETGDRTTLATDSMHCVQLVVYPPDKRGLDVLGSTGKVRWKTQPSSTNIKRWASIRTES